MTTTQTTTSHPAGEVQRFRVTVTVVGAVCSAVVTALLAAEGASLTSRLVGTAVGAAIPPLVGAVGPGHEIRMTVAVLLTAAAVVLGYGGDQLVSGVTGKAPSLPTPNEIVTRVVDPEPQTPVEPEATGSLVESEPPLEITVSPGAITCDDEGRCDTVTVTSTGTATLHVTSHEFEGDAASYLTATGCEDTLLEPGRSCTITPTFSPEDAPETVVTHLVIHQNFTGPATYVPVTAGGDEPIVPNLASSRPDCDLSGLAGDPDGGDVVTGDVIVEAQLTATGLPEGTSVEAAVYVDGAFQWQADVDLAAGTVRVEEFYSGPVPSDVVVVVDPERVVQESDEGDNVARCP